MTVYIDADACPVTAIAEQIAKKYNISVCILCDTNHVLSSNYSSVITVDAGADSVDFALVNRCNEGDIVITQDYGVAAMALSKKCYAIHQSGMQYTDDNIGALLTNRYIAKEARRSTAKCHIKGPKKRTAADDKKFAESFEKLIIKIKNRSLL